MNHEQRNHCLRNRVMLQGVYASKLNHDKCVQRHEHCEIMKKKKKLTWMENWKRLTFTCGLSSMRTLMRNLCFESVLQMVTANVTSFYSKLRDAWVCLHVDLRFETITQINDGKNRIMHQLIHKLFFVTHNRSVFGQKCQPFPSLSSSCEVFINLFNFLFILVFRGND